MRPTIPRVALILLLFSLTCIVPSLLANKKGKETAGSNEQKRAVHALNRLTFGPRPGELQQVMRMGVDNWIELQLHPERISDKDVEARVVPLRTLRMSTREILENFPDRQMIKLVADGKRRMPSDPERRAIYQVQIARLEERQERKQKKQIASAQLEPTAAESARATEELVAAANATLDGSSDGAPSAMDPANDTLEMARAATSPTRTPPPTPEEEAEARRREDRLYADLKVQRLIDLPPDERYKKVLALSVDEQLAFVEATRGGKDQEFFEGFDSKQREVLLAMNNPPPVVVEELSQAKLLRAIYGERQLEEVMTDFWFNHFNVFIGKGPERVLLTDYEQEVIRPHALGKFEDLLVATAKSPAMLYYLDNWMSVGPNSAQATGASQNPGLRHKRRVYRGRGSNSKRKPANGLNENYGRELLELHTVSVNGGYSQRDVTEVAKVFTGWTIDKPFDGMGFRFEPRMHEPGPKFVLGHHIKPKGEAEGREVLHLLATSPQTAHFISLKLAQRFVSDDPPAGLVDRMAKTFEKKKGDIREVLSTLFHSPEFWADTAYRAKVKTPLEFVASAIRGTGASVDDALPLIRQLKNMGMPLYGAQPPTGYSMKAETWVSSSALLNRMNFALALTGGKIRGVKVDAARLVGSDTRSTDASAILAEIEAKLLSSGVSKETHDSIIAQLSPSEDPKGAKRPKMPDASAMAGLLLGSPEFQKR